MVEDGLQNPANQEITIPVFLRIAGKYLAIESADYQILEMLRQRYSRFISNDDPKKLWRLRWSRRAGYVVQEKQAPVEISLETDSLLRIGQPGWQTEIDLDRRQGHIIAPESSLVFDCILRALLPHLLQDGLVLHSTLLVDGDRSWICSGPSGCGKSTLASMLPNYAVCDELSALCFEEDRFVSHALPFWVARQGNAPLSGIYLLHHASENSRKILGQSEALRLLVSQTAWPAGPAKVVEQTFHRLVRLVQSVPVYRLDFRPNPGVWQLIAADADDCSR